MKKQIKMRNVFLHSILLVGLLLVSCNSRQEKLMSEIKKLEETVRNQTVPGKEEGNKLVVKYLEFADAYPEDTITPTILYNAARVSVSISNPQQSVDILQRLIDKYPESKPIADAYVFLGFVYETALMDFQKAGYWYELFLRDFPNHPMYEDVRFSLNNLGKSPDEIVAEFMKQAEEEKDKR
jgi:tetratricopeptide (TPR) repeat protein